VVGISGRRKNLNNGFILKNLRRNNMNFWTMTKKGLLAVATFAVSFVTPQLVLKLVPDSIENMTVGSIIAFVIVAGTNWVKNAGKK